MMRRKRETEEFVGHDRVDLVGDFAAFFLCHGDGVAAGSGEHCVAAVGHEGVGFDCVFVPEVLDLGFDFVVSGFELGDAHGSGIVFQKLDCEEARGDVFVFFNIESVDSVCNGFDGVVDVFAVRQHGNAMVFELREGFRELGEQRADAVGSASDGLDDRGTEILFQFRNVELKTFSLGVVAHIESEEHGDVEFGELGCEIEAAARNGGIHDVQNQIDSWFCELLEDDVFFGGGGREGVYAGQVDEFNFHVVQYK